MLTNAPNTPPLEALPEQSVPRVPPNGSRIRHLFTVVIDPGHNSEDPGTTGGASTHKKDMVSLIARILKVKIDAQPNTRATMTHDPDYFVLPGAHVQKARRV